PSAGRQTLRFRPLRPLLALAAVGLAVPVSAADVTLTQALLDSVNGFVNSSKPTLGSGAQAIPNTLGPADTAYLATQTRQLITLVNLTQGTASNPSASRTPAASSSSTSRPAPPVTPASGSGACNTCTCSARLAPATTTASRCESQA